MNPGLRIILVEDSPADARLIDLTLRASQLSYQLDQIQTEAELRGALAAGPDLILSDHGLPSFDGFRALAIVRETAPDLPFIFVSGSNDQGMVARMYELGATDYVFKPDLGDLGLAVRAALGLDNPEPSSKSAQLQQELKLKLPAPSTAPLFASPLGHVNFCPSCRHAEDDLGHAVDLERYLAAHDETVVYREPCQRCAPRKSGKIPTTQLK